VAPKRKIGVDPGFERGEVRLVDPRDLWPRELDVAQLVERISTPQGERLAEQRAAGHDVAVSDHASSTGAELLESVEIHREWIDAQRVAISTPLNDVGTEQPAKIRHVPLQCVGRAGGWRVAPHIVHEAVDRHRRSASQGERGEQRLQANAANRDRDTVITDGLQRAHQANLHTRTVREPARNRCRRRPETTSHDVREAAVRRRRRSSDGFISGTGPEDT
jgi:hypothetical protein